MSLLSDDSSSAYTLEARRVLEQFGWQLRAPEDLAQRAAALVRAGISHDPRRAVIGAYCETLYAACCGEEGDQLQNRAYTELGRYLTGSLRTHYPSLRDDLREDVVQDALLRIHRSLARCQHPIAFFTFAAWHLRDAFQFARRRDLRDDEPLDRAIGEDRTEPAHVRDPHLTPEEQALAMAHRQGIEQLLAEYVSLHPQARRQIDVLRMTYLDQLADPAIAERLQTTVAAVQVMRTRIRQSFKGSDRWRARAHDLGLFDA